MCASVISPSSCHAEPYAHLTSSVSPSTDQHVPSCRPQHLPCSQYAQDTVQASGSQAASLPSSCAHLTFSMSPGWTSGCAWPHSLAAALATERCSGVRPSSSKEPSMLLKKRWLLWMASRAAFSFAGCLGTSRLQAGHAQGWTEYIAALGLSSSCWQLNADLLALRFTKATPHTWDACKQACTG